ncbi:PadR family transcriptional regulator [Amycolatopsis sp. DSM 110486]|uniref:PadR family transcriptional regulator n=1 Tax=Amycolatopsis sp. DSM 110486 TaxID=2865832 RepID=UPI001C6987E4|nr:PadR family transcriptional regulator [Amycolatopsis sp. DSM 110486]QYN22776.1 PadR family transcriptional regulator [Amycolatopsis sp. DSM 110486]
MKDTDLLDAHRQELWRGTVVLASLLALQKPGYGYGLLDALERAGVPAPANTLYPLLRRLEGQGLLTSEWDTSGTRPRKFYRTSRDGLRLARELQKEWQAIDTALSLLDTEADPETKTEEDTELGEQP